ncbi:MAG: hypothetical protein DRI01_09235, partial [Chloroflexi bacterium]
AGKKAGDYLRCYHGLLYRTLVAASTALCLGLGGIATSDIEQSSVLCSYGQLRVEQKISHADWQEANFLI